MELEVRPDGEGRYIISCPTEMEWRLREQLLTTFINATAGETINGVIIDLQGVSFISSAGLGGIFSLRKHVDAAGAQMVLARPSVSINRLFKTVNIEALVPVAATLDEARATLCNSTDSTAD